MTRGFRYHGIIQGSFYTTSKGYWGGDGVEGGGCYSTPGFHGYVIRVALINHLSCRTILRVEVHIQITQSKGNTSSLCKFFSIDAKTLCDGFYLVYIHVIFVLQSYNTIGLKTSSEQ